MVAWRGSARSAAPPRWTAKCENHPCTAHCSKTVCDADTKDMCEWEAATGTCVQAECMDQLTKTDCETYRECEWDVLKTPSCNPKPCYATTEAKCFDLGPQCEWKSTNVPPADPSRVKGCALRLHHAALYQGCGA